MSQTARGTALAILWMKVSQISTKQSLKHFVDAYHQGRFSEDFCLYGLASSHGSTCTTRRPCKVCRSTCRYFPLSHVATLHETPFTYQTYFHQTTNIPDDQKVDWKAHRRNGGSSGKPSRTVSACAGQS